MKSQHHAQVDHYFDEALGFTYALQQAKTRKDWNELGKRFEQLGRSMKYESRNKRNFKSSHGVEE